MKSIVRRIKVEIVYTNYNTIYLLSNDAEDDNSNNNDDDVFDAQTTYIDTESLYIYYVFINLWHSFASLMRFELKNILKADLVYLLNTKRHNNDRNAYLFYLKRKKIFLIIIFLQTGFLSYKQLVIFKYHLLILFLFML